VRYRGGLPHDYVKGTSTYEIPFGAIERPKNIEFPTQNWVDYGDGRKGVALINRGIPATTWRMGY